jgi:tetratricopeptide (TPR) repeat protein
LAIAACASVPKDGLGESSGILEAASSLNVAPCRTHDTAQESGDSKLLQTALNAMQTGGQRALANLMPDIEKALARAPNKPSDPEQCGNTVNVYSSNIADFLWASAVLHSADGVSNVVMLEPLPYARLYFVASWNAYEKGDYEKAAALCAKGLVIDPKDAMLASEYANALEIAGHNETALAFVDKFIAENPLMEKSENALMLRRRGYALGELGRFDAAIAAYEQSLSLEPGNKTALNEIEYNKQQKAAQTH